PAQRLQHERGTRVFGCVADGGAGVARIGTARDCVDGGENGRGVAPTVALASHREALAGRGGDQPVDTVPIPLGDLEGAQGGDVVVEATMTGRIRGSTRILVPLNADNAVLAQKAQALVPPTRPREQ